MNSFPAHRLAQTVNCKVHGCAEQAISARGRYAKLCETHRTEKATATAATTPARTSSPSPARVVSIKQAAQKLVPAAADLDKALGRRLAAREDARQAFTVFKQALDELHRVAKEAVA